MADTWLQRHAVTEESQQLFAGLWSGCSSAVLGRRNYQGFAAVWPGIVANPGSDTRTRAVGRWLHDVDKAVVSTTLTPADTTWGPSRVFASPRLAVEQLQREEGSDILVLQSQQVVAALLADDLVDHLHLTTVPVLLGGGLRLLPEGIAPSDWRLGASTVLGDGAVAAHWLRERG